MERQQVWPLIGGILLVVGSFLPWGRFGLFTIAGTDGDGMFSLIGGVIVVALALVKKTTRLAGVITLLVSVLAGWIVLNIYSNFAEDIESIGTGLYVTGLGAFLTFAASLDMMKSPIVTSVQPPKPLPPL